MKNQAVQQITQDPGAVTSRNRGMNNIEIGHVHHMAAQGMTVPAPDPVITFITVDNYLCVNVLLTILQLKTYIFM